MSWLSPTTSSGNHRSSWAPPIPAISVWLLLVMGLAYGMTADQIMDTVVAAGFVLMMTALLVHMRFMVAI
jgi:hypothetical protein